MGWGRELLDLDGAACRFDFLFDVFGFLLGDAFLERLGSALDERLGFGEPEASDDRADFLDDRDLFRGIDRFQDYIERGFLFGGSCGCASSTSGCGHGHRSGGADAPLLCELFYEISDFQNGKPAELFHECGCICQRSVFFGIVGTRSFGLIKTGRCRSDEEPFVSCLIATANLAVEFHRWRHQRGKGFLF